MLGDCMPDHHLSITLKSYHSRVHPLRGACAYFTRTGETAGPALAGCSETQEAVLC